MIKRDYWINRIETAWKTRPIVWLSGVRRAGKTSIARMLPETVFLNCDLPSTIRMLEDPEEYFKDQKAGTRIIMDEIHRLPDPSNVLKIAADAFPDLRILATGSSTLAATRKFRDTLTGRKWTIYLPPVLWTECRSQFDVLSLDKRLIRGGLPEPLMAQSVNAGFFSEWMDSYYARDISELFGVRDRSGFMNLLKLLLMQSGGLADFTKLASESELSRPAVKSHIEAMSIAHAIYLVKPFHGGGQREIVKRPKIYGFDTGLTAFLNGWESLRDSEKGVLWEHLVLDALRAAGFENEIHYWMDKSDREIDFVLHPVKGRADIMECKINPDKVDIVPIKTFRSIYPHGINSVISPKIEIPYSRKIDGITIRFASIQNILDAGHE